MVLRNGEDEENVGKSPEHLQEVQWSTYVLDQLRRLLVAPVKDLLVVVHPHLCQTHLVAGNHLRSFGKAVRALGAEHVAHD